MAHNGKNDQQHQGFQTTVQKAQQKMIRKMMNQKVTRQELAEFEQSYRNIIQNLLAVENFILDNVPGLRDKLKEFVDQQQAAAIPAPAPEATPDTPAAETPSQEQ